MGPDASTSIAISGRTIRGLVAMLASSCPNRSRSDVSDDWSSEDHQMAHVEALLRRTEPGHRDAATFPGRRRLDVVYRGSQGPDLDARSDHACIIGIRRPSGIVPRFQPNTTPVRTRPVPETIPHLLPDALAAGRRRTTSATHRKAWVLHLVTAHTGTPSSSALTSGSMPCSRARLPPRILRLACSVSGG